MFADADGVADAADVANDVVEVVDVVDVTLGATVVDVDLEADVVGEVEAVVMAAVSDAADAEACVPPLAMHPVRAAAPATLRRPVA